MTTPWSQRAAGEGNNDCAANSLFLLQAAGDAAAAAAAPPPPRHFALPRGALQQLIDAADVDGDGQLDILLSRFGSIGLTVPGGAVELYTRTGGLGDWSMTPVVPRVSTDGR